jgi:threonine synthase
MLAYRSTRGGAEVPLSTALSSGLAPDGGLYVPTRFPTLTTASFPEAGGVAAVAEVLLAPFFAGDRLEAALPDICAEALDLPAPLVALDETTWLLELFHGPSAAFKDFGARFLASCLSRLQAGEDRPATILVATSGDTGGAVAAAFHGKPDVEVVILYPKGKVSARQAHQLACWGDNIATLAVDGDFDACQAMVKGAFRDPVCQQARRLASANSINIGRLLPQMAYHAAAALQQPGAASIIPTGNMGNAAAAVWARRVGLPVGRVVTATNANDTLSRLQATGTLDPRPTVPTLANAMDVAVPSNLERLRDAGADPFDRLDAISVDDAAIRAAIVAAREATGQVLCPHTAAAYHVRPAVAGPAILAATAHPSKFDTVVEPLIGEPVPVPPALAALLELPTHEEPLAADLDALRDWLVSTAS